MTKNLPYRRCAGVALVNRAGEVFIGRRASAARRRPWSPATNGRCRRAASTRAKTPFAGRAARTLRGDQRPLASLIAEAPEWLSYDLPADAGNRWRGRYRGQTQKWFLFRFDGRGGGDRHPAPGRRRAQARIRRLALGALRAPARARRAVQARRSTRRSSRCSRRWRSRPKASPRSANPLLFAKRFQVFRRRRKRSGASCRSISDRASARRSSLT